MGITWRKRKALESSTMAVRVRMAADNTLLPDVRLVVVALLNAPLDPGNRLPFVAFIAFV